MNYCICLDSSNTELTVGIGSNNKVLKETNYEAWQTQSEHMILELNKLLDEFNVQTSDIAEVIVSIGPGSYTGVRIALTIAKTIGAVLNVPVKPVSSLRILKVKNEPCICLINARSSRSYFGVFKGDKIVVSDQILNNEEVLKYINEHPDYLVCGDTKYLGIAGIHTNIVEEMMSLGKVIEPIENIHALKPTYLKD